MAQVHRDEIAQLEALHSASPDGRVFVHLAEAYRRAGERTRALEVLTTGLRRHEDYPSAHIVLGRVYRDDADYDSAIAAYRRAAELDGGNGEALRALGELLSARGRVDEAAEYLREAYRIDPEDEDLARLHADVEAAHALEEHGDDAGETSDADPVSAPGASIPGAEGEAAADFEWDAGLSVEAEITFIGADAATADESAAPDEMAAAAAFEDAGLVTETIADLYARQGLYDRAAAVIRRMLRERPGDERLEGKLRELEEAARAAGADDDGSLAGSGGSEGHDVAASERSFEEIEFAWTGAQGAAESSPSPFSWTDDPATAHGPVDSTSIGEYLTSLLAWRPAVPGVAAPADSPAADHMEDGGATADAIPALEATVEQERRPVLGADIEEEFDRLFDQNLAPIEPPGESRAPEPSAPVADETVDATSEEAPPEDDDDDDDLERFREWLQSLKR